jgi:hypothetical protein
VGPGVSHAGAKYSYMNYNAWVDLDSEGKLVLKFEGSIALDKGTLKWVEWTTKNLQKGDLNYINPLFSSDSQAENQIAVELRSL